MLIMAIMRVPEHLMFVLINKQEEKNMDRIHAESITIKIRTEHGCFCRNHSRETNRLIDEIFQRNNSYEFDYHEHESGPEIIAWLALGTAGLTVTKSLIDLITAIINACKEGRKKGDNQGGKLMLIVRDTYRTENSTEEIVLEIYENDLIDSAKVKKAIESGVNNKFNKKHSGESKQ